MSKVVSFLTVFVALMLCGQGVTSWRQIRREEADNKLRRTITVFWDSNREKVTKYFENNSHKFVLDHNSEPLLLPNSFLNQLNPKNNEMKSKRHNRLKVLEVTGSGLSQISTPATTGRINHTCSKVITTTCRSYREFRIPIPCTAPSPPSTQCYRVQNQTIHRSCRKNIATCCEGYKVGKSGYCVKIGACSGIKVLKSASGTITSPGYPNNYPNYAACTWRVRVPANNFVIVKLVDVDMERPLEACDLMSGRCYSQCEYDKLRLRILNRNVSKTLCGNLLPQREYVFSGNQLEIELTSDDSNNGRGFKLHYSIVSVKSLTPQTCSNGQVWKLCRRVCLLTCEDTLSPKYGSWNICIRKEGASHQIDPKRRDDITCTPGCECPSSTPIWRNNQCSKIESCPQSIFKCGNSTSGFVKKIIGGSTAADGAWPWMVQISNNMQDPDCGGALICSNWLVTAAHCFLDKTNWTMPKNINPALYWFHLGKYWKFEQNDQRRVESFRALRVIVHPDYNFENDQNDIALVELNGFVRQWDRIRPICLPLAMPNNITSERIWEKFEGVPRVGDKCVTAGWGINKDVGPSSRILKQARLPITKSTRCSYESFIWRKVICAGGLFREDTCQGDSGGPLMCRASNRWVLRGITSFGEDCGTGIPGGYTRVSYYVPWIRKYIGNLCAI